MSFEELNMKTIIKTLSNNRYISSDIIMILILLAVILLGVFFRFANLENKIVWHDEALTISRVSGYYAEEINKKIFNGKTILLDELKQYQEKNTQSRNLDIIKILATDNPQHPPVYYLLLRLWGNLWGFSIETLRSLSALWGILLLPAIYFLCRELEKNRLTGFIATAIIAVSPLHILYAQEAREYSLWTLSIVISSITFFKALKNKTALSWIVYSICSLISIYIFPFSLFIFFGQGFYVWLKEKHRFTKTVRHFLISCLFAIAGAFPWLWLIFINWDESGSVWTTTKINHFSLVNRWGENIYKLFILNTTDNKAAYFLILSFILLTIVCSFVTLVKQEKRDVLLYIIILAMIFFLPLAGVDLVFGGQRSISSRYVIPSLLGIQIAVAFSLNCWLKSQQIFIRQIAYAIVTAIIIAGITSCAVNLPKNIAWSKGGSDYLIDAASIINQAKKPLVVGNSLGLNFGNILALSHLLEDDSKLLLVDGWKKPDYINMPSIPQNFDNIFFLSVSDKFKERIEKKYDATLESIYYDDQLNIKQLTQ